MVKQVSESPSPKPAERSDYTVITYIHGDGEYLFHDSGGRPVQADENALKKMQHTARAALNGEYIIFHQQREKEYLWFIPRRNSMVYHYKNGELINQLSYRSASIDGPFLTTESEIYRDLKDRYSVNTEKTLFFYFGHEIPLYPGEEYHISRPGIDVHTVSFTKGIQSFLEGKESFDLVALSTCNNGTPTMIYNLQGVADTVLASPQNLHLSHIDTGALSLLNSNPAISASQLADSIASSTFKRLTEDVRTTITLSVYDLASISAPLHNLYIQYKNYVELEKPNLYLDNTDCFKLPYLESIQESKIDGVHILFRPARFGRESGITDHSGWGCKGPS